MTTDPLPAPVGENDTVGLTLIPGSLTVVDDATVRLAVRLVDTMDLVDHLTQWKEDERKGPGGRPETFSMYALLVVMTLCAITDQPMRATRIRDVMFRQLSPKWRAQFGIPDPPAIDDTNGWRALCRNVRTRLHTMLDLMDPSPTPKNRRLDDPTYRAVTERRRTERSDEERARRDENLAWFVNRCLEASMCLLPVEDRAKWNGSVAVDATLVRSFSRPPRSSKKQIAKGNEDTESDIDVHSADPDAGWYGRTPDRPDDGAVTKAKYAWGYEASLVVSGCGTPASEPAFPNLVVAMAPLHKPGHEPGRNGARALASVRARGHPAGYVAADRAYSNAIPETFQLPARALGYKPVYDYKIDQLGVKGSYQGFSDIEGALYCPAIPQPLIDATLDYREGRIDETLYGQRLQERWRYRAWAKGQPDAEGHIRYQCPAATQWNLARCDLKPASLGPKTQGRLRVLPAPEMKASPSACCTQQSVTVPPEAGAKFRQPLLYGSTEWKITYNMLRNTVEGMNGYVKDPAHEALDEPGRRRIHGVAAQSVLTAFLLMAANVRKIRTFLATKAARRSGTPPSRSRRRRTKPIETWRPTSPVVLGNTGEPDPPLIA